MGYCTYGGKPVPGNNQASCIGGGGNWVGGETLPGSQLGGPAMQLPDIGRPPIRPEPDRGIPGYQAPQISQSPERMWDNTDDFGNRLNTDQFGNNNFGLLRDRAVNKQNTNALNESGMFARGPDVPSDIPNMPNLNAPKTDTSKMSIFDKATHFSEQAAPLVSQAGKSAYDLLVPEELVGKTADFITDPVKRAEYVAFMKANPGTTVAAGLASVGVGKLINKVYKKVKGIKRYEKTGGVKPRVDTKGNVVTPGTPGMANRTIAGDAAKVYVGGQVGKEVLDEPFLKSKFGGGTGGGTGGGADLLTPNKPKVNGPVNENGLFTPPTNKKNGGLLVDGLTGDDLKNVAKKGDIPTSMWDKMQTKGYWMDGVEGGSGKWDNRLFRLGEMMAHMGTPLSKQGKSPAERWTTANTAANTLKATNAKASGISAGKATDAQRKSWVSMIPNETTLIKQFLKDKPGIISDSAPGTKEYANAASKAANYVWIGNQLIGDGIEPTPSNIQKRAKKIKDEKK